MDVCMLEGVLKHLNYSLELYKTLSSKDGKEMLETLQQFDLLRDLLVLAGKKQQMQYSINNQIHNLALEAVFKFLACYYRYGNANDAFKCVKHLLENGFIELLFFHDSFLSHIFSYLI